MHHHDEHCGCGCHHHEHGDNCGCGHDHVEIVVPEGLTPIEVDILMALRQLGCLPVACFSLTKRDDDARRAIALAPVYLSAPEDSMEQVKELGKVLTHLEDMDLITLDYDMTLKNYPYDEYKTSELYAYFVKTVEEGAQQPNAAFDTPKLELGSMALTDSGEEMLNSLTV